jgi:osmotically-inducible protein OsmY
VDVTSLVDDLIAPGGPEGAIVDAEVVEDSRDDERIAQTVSDVLAILPDVPSEAVSVEVSDGTVFLRGEVDRTGTIRELEERVRQIDGVTRLRNLLHLPGTPPPG